MMDGWAIQDDFRDGFYEGFRATTFRAWDRREKAWRGYWLDGPSGRWSRPLIHRQAGFDTRAAWLADPEAARQRADRHWAKRAAGS